MVGHNFNGRLALAVILVLSILIAGCVSPGGSPNGGAPSIDANVSDLNVMAFAQAAKNANKIANAAKTAAQRDWDFARDKETALRLTSLATLCLLQPLFCVNRHTSI